MKYESFIWAVIAILAVTVMCVQTDRLNKAQARVADLEMGVK